MTDYWLQMLQCCALLCTIITYVYVLVLTIRVCCDFVNLLFMYVQVYVYIYTHIYIRIHDYVRVCMMYINMCA